MSNQDPNRSPSSPSHSPGFARSKLPTGPSLHNISDASYSDIPIIHPTLKSALPHSGRLPPTNSKSSVDELPSLNVCLRGGSVLSLEGLDKSAISEYDLFKMANIDEARIHGVFTN